MNRYFNPVQVFSIFFTSYQHTPLPFSMISLHFFQSIPTLTSNHLPLPLTSPNLPSPSSPPSLFQRYSSPLDLKGLVLDLRGNPGGLLDAAVEIASYLVPSKSDIVSAKSRNGEEVIYRSVIDPIRPPGMKLAVMVCIFTCVCVCVCVCGRV